MEGYKDDKGGRCWGGGKGGGRASGRATMVVAVPIANERWRQQQAGGGGRTTDDVGERETTNSRGDFGDECMFIYC